jgi:CO/xanthine dehydrogenase FAD-binding subunit
MKAAVFDYMQPSQVEEVCRSLADHPGESKIIAGGQSLVPMMAMRLVRPTLLIDINNVAALQGVRLDGETLVIGACTRQAETERSPLVREHTPLLAKALPFVAHDQIRNRGTVGGSLAHADPSAEIALVAVALDASLTMASLRGERTLSIGDFLIAPMTTAIAEDECLTDIRLPVWRDAARVGTGFQEVSSRAGDFAIVAAAAQLAFDDAGICRHATVAVANAAPTPLRARDTESALIGSRLDDGLVGNAAALVDASIEPVSDLHASARTRRRIARSLVARAVMEAARDAGVMERTDV